jgi:hypothetical protein
MSECPTQGGPPLKWHQCRLRVLLVLPLVVALAWSSGLALRRWWENVDRHAGVRTRDGWRPPILDTEDRTDEPSLVTDTVSNTPPQGPAPLPAARSTAEEGTRHDD